jgi:hypothetical protein
MHALPSPRFDLSPAADGTLRVPTPGIIRPDEGTIECAVRFSKPTREFGNNWEFLFTLPCGKNLGPGGNTLLGAYIAPEPAKGLFFLVRSSQGRADANATDFTCREGESFNLAFTWGRDLRLYVNGELKARSPWAGLIAADTLSPFIYFERLGPYNTSQVSISTRERRPEELASVPGAAFTVDEDTTFLAVDGLTNARLFKTPWHLKDGAASLLPVLRSEAMCFNEGDEISLPFLGVNHGARTATRDVTCVAQNAEGVEILRKTTRLEIPAGGAHVLCRLPLPEIKGPGHFPVRLSLEGAGAPVIYPVAVAVIGRSEPTAKAGAFARYYGQHIHPEWDPSVWQRMGVRSSRAWSSIFTFLWWSVEPLPGQFDFRKSDAYVKQCGEAGMEVLGVLGYPSRWAALDPGETKKQGNEYVARPERWMVRDREAWRRYIYETVHRYKDKVQHWEIYNEVNFHPPAPALSFGGSTRDYFDLLKDAYAEAKRANPRAVILCSGFSPVADLSMPTDLLSMGGAEHFDIFATHGYGGRFKGVDGDWVEAFWRLKPKGLYWQTEQMWHTITDDRLRMYKTVETFVDFLSSGCDRFFNMGDMGIFFERATQAPRVDYCAVAGVQQNLRLCDAFEGREAFPGDGAFYLRHRFRRSDGAFLTILGSVAGRHEVLVKGEVVAAFDIFQRPVLPITKGGNVAFLQSNVLYILSPRPIAIAQVTAVEKEGVSLRNGGFEELSGDTIAGLSGCKPLDWILRERKFDPLGAISLAEGGRSGKYTIRIAASGKGPVYLFQEVTLRAPGAYRLSAHFRATTPGRNLLPYLFLLDNNTGKNLRAPPPVSGFSLPSDRFLLQEFDVEIPEAGSKPVAVGFGISGEGEVLLDDVSFGPAKARFDGSRYLECPLDVVANQTKSDEAAGDGRGGFADLGADNLVKMESGERVLGGHSFRILDDEKGRKNSLVMLGGGLRPSLVRAVEIPLRGAVGALVFLHTSLWVKAKAGEILGHYVITDEDGAQTTVPLVHKGNIDDWYGPQADPKVLVGDRITQDDGSDRLVYLFRWENPRPGRSLRSVRMVSDGKAILVLAALSIEKTPAH